MQLKTLSLKGKGFKGPLKGAETVVHRRLAKICNAKVVRGEPVNALPKAVRCEPVNALPKVVRGEPVNARPKVVRGEPVNALPKVVRGEPVTELNIGNFIFHHPEHCLRPLKLTLCIKFFVLGLSVEKR